MKFIRLTSVFLCCALLSCFLTLSASAIDDNNYYSLPSVASGGPSLVMDWPVSPAVSHDGFLAEDSENLARIMTDLTTTGMTTLKTYVWDIRDALSRGGSIFDFLSDITDALTSYSVRGTLAWYIKDIDNLLASLNSSLGDGLATEATLSKVATESTLSAFSSAFSDFFGVWKYYFDGNSWAVAVKPDGTVVTTNFATVLNNALRNLSYDAELNYPDRLTLRGMVKRLQETLASDDDVELAKNQKENREQAESDFLSGQSGKTSLGKDDFGSLSSVGGTFKDISSLNGQASLDSFSSGLSDADTAGQGWFSQSTKNALDSVSGSTSSESTVSTFSDDGLYFVDIDPDPFNMGDFENHYAWLWGDD